MISGFLGDLIGLHLNDLLLTAFKGNVFFVGIFKEAIDVAIGVVIYLIILWWRRKQK